MSRQFIEIFPGNEGQLNNSLDAADMELTEVDVNMLINERGKTYVVRLHWLKTVACA